MTVHAHAVRRREPGLSTPEADETTAPLPAVGFRPAPLLGDAARQDLPNARGDGAAAHRAVLRRTILDTDVEEDVFDAAEGKRDAEVANLSLDRLVSGQNHTALAQFVGARQAAGPLRRPMAELRATRKIADNRIRKSVRSGVDAARAQHVVTGGADRSGMEQLLATKAARGADFDTAAHLKGERRQRRNTERAASRAKHNAEVAERNRAAGLEIQQAKKSVESKSASMTKALKAGRAAMRTEHEPAEMTQFVTALDAKNWPEALAALGHVESASAAALGGARSRLAGRAADIAEVENYPAYHRPTDLTARREAVDAAIADQQWPTIAEKVADFLAVVDLARDFASRLAAIEAESANLTNAGRKLFMKEQVEAHKKLGWTAVRDDAEKEFTKPSLAFLETRLEDYQKRDLAEQASKDAAAAVAAAATRDALERREAARRLRQERLDKGLLAGNQTVIVEKKVTELTGTGEQAAVKQTLDAIDKGTVPVLTHNNGKRWAFPHQNRDGDLPGARGSGGYLEYYVEKDPASPTYHGSRRVVVHQTTKRRYYSWTHYGENGNPAFVLISE